MRLDSLCLLLEKKEHLLITITNIYNKLAEIDEAVKDYPRPLPPADFTALLEDEKYWKEMLSMFVHDTEGVPLWETTHIRVPVSELKRLVSLPPKTWNDEQLVQVRKLTDAVEPAVKTAIRLREEIE